MSRKTSRTSKQISALKKRWRVADKLGKETGKNRLHLFFDAAYCAWKDGASAENYYVLRLFEVSRDARGTYLTSGRSKTMDAVLNREALTAHKKILADKAAFDSCFADMIRRDFLDGKTAGEKEIQNFLNKHRTVYLKPPRGTQGKGIERIDTKSVRQTEELVKRIQRQGILLEEGIQQHSAMEALNSDCVNSVRINAARSRADGKVYLIGAALKCGVGTAPVDNFHSGAVAYTLDVESGKVMAPGRDNRTLKQYIMHPNTSQKMEDFSVPNWTAVRETVFKAMNRLNTMGYVGWDLAVTEEGAELIEGNYSYPGGNIIQLDGVGKYPALKACLGGES